MDPDAARQRIVDALTAGDDAELNYAVDDLSTWLHRGGFPPGDGAIKVSAAQRRRLAERAPARLAELDALNELLKQRQQPAENPAADVHRMEAGQALERGETLIAQARERFKKGRLRDAYDKFVLAVAVAAVATKETLHSGQDAFSEQQYKRIEQLNVEVAQMSAALRQAVPERSRKGRR